MIDSAMPVTVPAVAWPGEISSPVWSVLLQLEIPPVLVVYRRFGISKNLRRSLLLKSASLPSP
jgi:hypothetical protein